MRFNFGRSFSRQAANIDSSPATAGEGSGWYGICNRTATSIKAGGRTGHSSRIKLFDAGSLELAAAEFEKAVAADPENGLAHDWLGVEYSVMGPFDDARKEFDRSISLDPNSWSGHYDFAVLLSQTGDLGGAVRSARRALALMNSNPHVHLLLGFLLWQNVETRAEGLEHLQIAARSLAQAKGLLSNLHER